MRAAAYIRVSTTDQARDGLSLGEQRRRVEEHIEQQGWELVDVYEDAGISGKREDRPELQRLLRDLPRLDRVVIPRLDRLGRSTVHLHRVYGELERAGVALVSLSENLDTSTPTGRLLRGVLSSVAEMESDNISERVRAVTGVRAREGRPHGGPAPYGYAYERGRLVVVPDEKAIVKRIYAEYIAGRSQRQIARDLDREGVRTKRGGRWSQALVARALSNPVHRGALRLNGTEYEGQHDPTIAADLWEQARTLREALTRTKGHGRGPAPKGAHLFRHGHLRCGCGEAMIPRTIRARSKNGDSYEVYLCYGRVRDVEACEQQPVPRKDVDEAVLSYFERVALDTEATREHFLLEGERRLAEARALRQRVDRDLLSVQADIDKVERDYLSGDLSAASYERLLAKKGEERDALAAELDLLRQREREAADSAKLTDADEALIVYLASAR